MPELPEVETIKRIVCPQLAGRTIETTEVRNAQVIAYPKSDNFNYEPPGKISHHSIRKRRQAFSASPHDGAADGRAGERTNRKTYAFNISFIRRQSASIY